MAAYYWAESENGVVVADPSEGAIRALVEGLNDEDNTSVVIEPDGRGASWYASVALLNEGKYEIVFRDPALREHAVVVETSVTKIAQDLILWLAARDFPGQTTTRGLPRPDVAGLARLVGWDLVEGEQVIPWDRSLEVAGLDFPSDYREFVDRFGPGELGGVFGILTPWPSSAEPGASDGFSRMVETTVEDVGVEFRKMREESFDLCPYPVYPERGGLLLWGSNYSGDQCFWLTEGSDPDRWPIVVWLRGEFPDGWRRYDMGMVRFLILALSGGDATLRDVVSYGSEPPVWIRDGSSAA